MWYSLLPSLAASDGNAAERQERKQHVKRRREQEVIQVSVCVCGGGWGAVGGGNQPALTLTHNQ